MKPIRVIRTLTRGLLVALVVVSGAASAYTLSFSPSAQDLGLGSSATVEDRITDVAPDPPASPGGLGGYDCEIVYDPGIIKFDKATDAGALGLAIGLDVDCLAPGRLNLSAVSLEDPTACLLYTSRCV